MAASTRARGGIRRHPRRRSSSLRLRYPADLRRPVRRRAAPAERDTPLAIAMPPDAAHPKVFEVLPLVFDLLAACSTIGPIRSALGATPEADELIADLAEHGLVEVRG